MEDLKKIGEKLPNKPQASVVGSQSNYIGTGIKQRTQVFSQV